MTLSFTKSAYLLAALLLILALPAGSHAKSPEIYTGLLSSTAVGGYDPVAGKSGITHSWKGVTWRFALEKNRDLFK